MIERKKKIRIIQFFLLILSLLIIYLTYYNKERSAKDPSISELNNEKIKDQVADNDSEKKNYFITLNMLD